MEWTLEALKGVRTGEEAARWLGARVVGNSRLVVLVRFGLDDFGSATWIGHNHAFPAGTRGNQTLTVVVGAVLPRTTGIGLPSHHLTRIVSPPSLEVYRACFSSNHPVDYRNTALYAASRKSIDHMTGFLGSNVQIRNMRDYYLTGIGKTRKGAIRWLIESVHIKRKTAPRKITLIAGVYPKKGHYRWVRPKVIASFFQRPEDGGYARMVESSCFPDVNGRIPAAYAAEGAKPLQLRLSLGVL